MSPHQGRRGLSQRLTFQPTAACTHGQTLKHGPKNYVDVLRIIKARVTTNTLNSQLSPKIQNCAVFDNDVPCFDMKANYFSVVLTEEFT